MNTHRMLADWLIALSHRAMCEYHLTPKSIDQDMWLLAYLAADTLAFEVLWGKLEATI